MNDKIVDNMIKETNSLLDGIAYINSLDLAPTAPVGALEAIMEKEEKIQQEWLVSEERNGIAETVSNEELEWLINNQ
jgi:hypothetical protein